MSVESLRTMRCELTEVLEQEMMDISKVDTREAGEVADIIKDLAMAEKYCFEAKYYESIVKAMDDSTDVKDYISKTKPAMETKHMTMMMEEM